MNSTLTGQLLAIPLLLIGFSAMAQDKPEKKALDSVDKVIIQTIIRPAEQAAGDQEPNWQAIEVQVRASYSEMQTDRALTKARIYYYYGRDWPKFSAAIVHYTQAYEDKDDLPLLNKNATFVLQHSENPADWKAALAWIQHALDKEPNNQTYQATRDALNAKLVGQ